MQNSYRKAESISHPHAAVAGFSRGERDHKTGSNGVANQSRFCVKRMQGAIFAQQWNIYGYLQMTLMNSVLKLVSLCGHYYTLGNLNENI